MIEHGFHIILACMGIGFPAVVMTAHYLGLRGDTDAPLLARRWSKVMAVLVGGGAVSGTVLSFDLGLLWPGLMGKSPWRSCRRRRPGCSRS